MLIGRIGRIYRRARVSLGGANKKVEEGESLPRSFAPGSSCPGLEGGVRLFRLDDILYGGLIGSIETGGYSRARRDHQEKRAADGISEIVAAEASVSLSFAAAVPRTILSGPADAVEPQRRR